MPAVCEVAPAPALLVWWDAGALRWAMNEAARQLAYTAPWNAAQWATLATHIDDAARQGREQGEVAGLGIAWHAAPHGAGWLAWLLAPHDALPREPAEPPSTGTQLNLAVGLVGIGLWRRDFATRRMQFNERANALLGRPPVAGDIADDELAAAIHPDDRDVVARADATALATGGIVDAEVRCVRPDGSIATLMTRRVVERDAQGRAVALVGVTLDITGEARERSRIIEIAQSIELVADATGVGVWSADLDSGETVWNRQMRRIHGLRDDEPLPEGRMTAVARAHPDDRARLAALFDALAEGRPVPEVLEIRIVRPDGAVRWVVGRTRAARHGGRHVLIGILMDVTEERLARERLQRAEQRTVLAAKAIGLASWERDLVESVSWWDEPMYLLRGLSPDDPRPAHELDAASMHADDALSLQRRLGVALGGESDFFFEFRIVRPDGEQRWLATRGTVTRDAQGRPMRVFGFDWDVTEHKRAEAVRREKAAAETASRAKSEFLSRMSHELRTPLNAVLGFAQLMLEDPAQPCEGRQRERAVHIRDAGRHLLALIDDVLDLTSVEASAVPLEPRAIALATLVRGMLEWMAPAAAQAQVTLQCGRVEGAVRADDRRLRQVLANLLSNAVKYNRTGGRVEIESLEGDAPGLLGLAVRDTGRGLTPEQLQRLFEPFNRLGAEQEGIEGTGIGLTIVRTLVEAMDGRVQVDSRPGEGSEFRVWLPRAGEPGTRPSPGLAAPAAASAKAPAGPLELVYVEDNPVNVLLVQELVALRPGVRLHVAPDGRSGIALARERKPAAVLIDLQLPDIDGMEVMRAVRADPQLAHVVCIAVSANAMPDDVARARRGGFDDYWTKPIDFGQFLGGLDALAARAARDAGAAAAAPPAAGGDDARAPVHTR